MDDRIPIAVAAALAYGRLVQPSRLPSPRELNEHLEVMATMLAAAIPAPDRLDGKVRAAALLEAIEKLRRDAATHSSEIIPR